MNGRAHSLRRQKPSGLYGRERGASAPRIDALPDTRPLGPDPLRCRVIPCPQERRTYFVTTVTANRRRPFQVETNALLMVETHLEYRAQHRFALHAFVVMPDHLHALLTPAPQVSLEKAMPYIKGGFSFRLKGRFPVWEKSYNEVRVSNAEKFDVFQKYIEENPVRSRLSGSIAGYPHSSVHCPHALDPIPSQFQVSAIRKAGLQPGLVSYPNQRPEGPNP